MLDHQTSSTRIVTITDDARLTARFFSMDGLKIRVPVWDEYKGFGALSLPTDPVDFYWLAVEPESMVHYAQQIVQMRPSVAVVMPLPIGGDESDLVALEKLASHCSNPLVIASRFEILPGIQKIGAFQKRGMFSKVHQVSIKLALSTPRGIHAASRFKADYDALLGEFENVFYLLDRLGLDIPTFEITNPISNDYYVQISLYSKTDRGFEMKVLLENHRFGETKPTEEIELLGPNVRLRWTYQSKETLSLRLGARNGVDTFDQPEIAPAILQLIQSQTSSGIPFSARLERHTQRYRTASALLDQFLHGRNRELREFRALSKVNELTTKGAPFEGYVPSSQAGFDLAFIANYQQSSSYSKSLTKPFRLLLLRAPIFDDRVTECLFPPLAMAQLSAAARMIGTEVQCVDLAALEHIDFTSPQSAELVMAKLQSKLVERQYDLIGITLEESAGLPFVQAMLQKGLRDVGKHILLGGRGAASLEYSLSNSPLVDSVIHGEGELGLLQLIRSINFKVSSKSSSVS